MVKFSLNFSHLVPFLAQQPFDKSLMDPPATMKPPEKPAASPMPPSTPESQDKDTSQKSDGGQLTSFQKLVVKLIF